jgi:FtsZ-interacting cell division protein ZipA
MLKKMSPKTKRILIVLFILLVIGLTIFFVMRNRKKKKEKKELEEKAEKQKSETSRPPLTIVKEQKEQKETKEVKDPKEHKPVQAPTPAKNPDATKAPAPANVQMNNASKETVIESPGIRIMTETIAVPVKGAKPSSPGATTPAATVIPANEPLSDGSREDGISLGKGMPKGPVENPHQPNRPR